MPRNPDRPPVVLLVEDNPANQLLVCALLEGEGISVVMATTGAETRRALLETQADLILMDIQLPGADGLDLTREIKADPATAMIPVIALTANAMAGDKEAALAAGCESYVAKPFDTRLFRDKVLSILG